MGKQLGMGRPRGLRLHQEEEEEEESSDDGDESSDSRCDLDDEDDDDEEGMRVRMRRSVYPEEVPATNAYGPPQMGLEGLGSGLGSRRDGRGREFNVRRASAKAREMEGYVSFSAVEGLGAPPEGESSEDERERERRERERDLLGRGRGVGGWVRRLWGSESAGSGAGAGGQGVGG